MTLHVSIVGIDGSGKSSLSRALPTLLASELGVTVAGVGDELVVTAPDGDLLLPGFKPRLYPPSARLARELKKAAKRVVDGRRRYPLYKTLQLGAADHAAWRLARRYRTDVVVTDGTLLLSALGRAANYLAPGEGEGLPEADVLAALLDHLSTGAELPAEMRRALPKLRGTGGLLEVLRSFGLRAGILPDVVVFLDLDPDVALSRIAARGAKRDRHENPADLAQARAMYRRTLEAFARRPGAQVLVADSGVLDEVAVRRLVVDALRPRLHSSGTLARRALHEPGESLAGGAVWRRIVSVRYLFGYLLRYWRHGSWRELTFPFSRPGRLLLREGYSARVMDAIYRGARGLFARVFAGYPLHRAVADRLGILQRRLGATLAGRTGGVRILTAPSGTAEDVLGTLERLGETGARIELVAVDLDPAVGPALAQRAAALGIDLVRITGSLEDPAVRARLVELGPYDLALFVGLSSWMPKPALLAHLRLLRAVLAPGGTLVTDCFRPAPYAVSGWLAGFRASYYTLAGYLDLLAHAGFDPARARSEPGWEGLNTVVEVG